MPYITVQLGQCGNQIGTQYFQALTNDIVNSPSGCAQDAEEDYKLTVLDQ